MSNVSETTSIFEAAQNNDIGKLKSLVEECNVPITIMNNLRQSLAHVAAKKGNLDVVKYVAERKPSILTKTDKYDFTVLRIAVRVGALDIVKYLVENHEADLTKQNDRDFRSTSMHTAIKYNRLDILKYLIEERHFDVNTPGEWENHSPIFSAVKYQRKDIISYLTHEKKANLLELDPNQNNILYVTVEVDDLSYMKHILDEINLPIDINWRNIRGETVVYRASCFNRTSMLQYLVGEKHADVNIASNLDELTPLHCAAIQNHHDICKYLIDNNAKADVKDKFGEIPAEKATNSELKSYLKTASVLKKKIIRNTRSILLPKLIMPHEHKYKRIPRRISADDGLISSVDVSQHMFQFQNFLTIAALSTRKLKFPLQEMGDMFLSPMLILQNRMNPVAMETINRIQKF